MSKGTTKLVHGVAICLLGGALLVGCGRGNSAEQSGGGSSDAPAGEPTRAGLPTMPSARFAAPTTMITPQSAGQEVEATATLTATEATTASEALTSTGEVTATEEMTDTE